MLTLSDGFQKQVELKNPNKLVFAKLFYDDETASTNVSTRSLIVGDTQFHGIVTRVSSPKSTWNWDNQNNVVVTTPTLELGNFESAVEDSSLIDEFYIKNYLGRKIELYIGFQNSASEDEFQQIYSGRVEDLIFADGKIKVVFKANDMPTNEIAGRLIDVQGRKVGDLTVGGLDESVDGLRVPVVYGNVWCAPGICVQYELDNAETDKRYLFSDQTKHALYTSSDASLASNARKSSGRVEKLINIYQNEYLVPISSYDITTDRTNIWAMSAGDSTYSGCLVTIDSSNEQYLDNSITAAIPLRMTEDAVVSADVQVPITDGSWEDVQDGSTSSYMQVTYSGGTTATNIDILEYGDVSTYNLRYTKDSQDEYGFYSARPIHVSDKSDADVTYFYGKIGIQSSINALPNPYAKLTWRSVIYGKDGITPIGGTGWGVYDGDNYFEPATAPNTLEYGTGVAGGLWDDEFVGSGFVETAYDYTEYGANNEILDATLSLRESLDNFRLKLQLHWYDSTFADAYQSVWRIYEWFLLHSSIIDLPKDYVYGEIKGTTISEGDTFYSLGTAIDDAPMKRPIHYIEALLRGMGSEDADFNGTEWANSNDQWSAIFGNRRDYSGFSITESTKFNDFLKEYLKYETYTVFRDELGKYKVKILLDEYDSGDVDSIINYNDCSDFEMSISKLNGVATDLSSLKVDYQYFSGDYTYNTSWAINASGYAYDFYDYTNGTDSGKFTKGGLEKRYTSHSNSYCVDYSGTSYSIRKDHTANISNPPDTSTEYYNAISASTADDPEWEVGQRYTTESSEAYQIARRYLNQFGNRHRLIKLSSKDMDFYKYQIGDVVSFENVPDTLLGMEISGFAGSTAATAEMNGQTVYPHFVVYSVLKDAEKVQLEVFQLHKLNDLTIKRGN